MCIYVKNQVTTYAVANYSNIFKVLSFGDSDNHLLLQVNNITALQYFILRNIYLTRTMGGSLLQLLQAIKA
jgi:hypothetical protein